MGWERMGWDGARVGWVRGGWDDVGWELAQKRGVGWDEWVGMDGKGVGYGMVWDRMGGMCGHCPTC